jgi:hypothetical protein
MSNLTPRLDKLERNLIINGNFDFWQRSINVNGSGLSVNAYSNADRVLAGWNFASGAPSFTFSRSTDVPTLVQSGFSSQYSWQLVSGNAKTFPSSNDYFQPFVHKIEGLNYQRVHGKPVVISFWFKASVTGTYTVSLQNAAGTRIYVAPFTVSSASTWEFKSLNIQLDTAGTWNFDNTSGLIIYIAALASTTLSTSTINQWGALGALAYTGATNWIATPGASINIAQLSLTEDTGKTTTSFERAGRTISDELILCQRYYFKTGSPPQGAGGPAPTTVSAYISMRFPVQMRVAPTLSGDTAIYSINNNGNFSSTTTTPSGAAPPEVGGGIWRIDGFTGLTATLFYQLTVIASGALTADAEL